MKLKSLFNWTLIVLAWIFLAMAFSACMTQSKYTRISDKHPEWTAPYCARVYPVAAVDSQTIIDSTRRAENRNWSSYIDSLEDVAQRAANAVALPDSGAYKDCKQEYDALRDRFNSVSSALASMKAQYKPCAPDTFLIRTTITVRDSAWEKTMRLSLQTEHDARVKAETQRDNRTAQRNWLAVAVLILGGLAVLKFIGKL